MGLVAQYEGRQEQNVSYKFSVVSQCSLRGSIRRTRAQRRYHGRPGDRSGTLLAFAVARDGSGGFTGGKSKFLSNCSVRQSGTGFLARSAYYIYKTLRGIDDCLHACSAKWFHPDPLGLVETISPLNKSHPPPPLGRLDDQCLPDGLTSEPVLVQPL